MRNRMQALSPQFNNVLTLKQKPAIFSIIEIREGGGGVILITYPFFPRLEINLVVYFSDLKEIPCLNKDVILLFYLELFVGATGGGGGERGSISVRAEGN